MPEIAKTFIVLGAVLICVGIILSFAGKIPGIGKFPGDILIKKENFTFYFPLTTSIIVSIILSLFFYLWQHK